MDPGADCQTIVRTNSPGRKRVTKIVRSGIDTRKKVSTDYCPTSGQRTDHILLLSGRLDG